MSDLSFTTFRDFFEYNFNKSSRDSQGSKTLTLQDFSKKLGYRSPSLLSMIATGKRLPSSEMLEELFSEWKVDTNLREIIRIRVEIEKRQIKNKPTFNLVEKLSKINKRTKYQTFEIDTFNSIKDWHNLVLQMMVGTPEFREDYVEISNRLKKKVTPTQVKKGIETLIKVGLIVRNPVTGSLEKNEPELRETTHDIPSEAIREHHKGMINRALEEVDEGLVSERHLNSLTLRFNPNDTTTAKSFILNFVKDFNEKFYNSESNEIAQLNIQFFGHTQYIDKSPSEKDLKS